MHNLFLMKDPGSPKITRLWVLHQTDSELQFLQRFFVAHKLVNNAEEHDCIADEQWGRRQGRTAIDLVLSEEIFMTTSHMQRAAGAIMDLDAAACHDRIVTNALVLAYAAAGLPWTLCLLFGRTLKQIKYYVTTACGPSSMFDATSPKDPFCGPDQGATDGPSA